MKKVLFLFLCFLAVFISFYVTWQKNPYNKASLLWESGSYQKAVTIWEDQLSYKENQKPASYQKLIESLIYLGKFDDAEKWCVKALTDFPKYVIFKFQIGLIKFYQGKFQESLSFSQDVLKENDSYLDIHLLRGLDFEKTGNIPEAKKEFIKEINYNSTNRIAWIKLKEIGNEKN